MDVFVYGTLTDAEQASGLLDSFAYVGPARLEGCHRVEGQYPTLAPGGHVDGRLLRTAEIETLDRYEGVDRGLYVRVTAPSASASVAASTRTMHESYLSKRRSSVPRLTVVIYVRCIAVFCHTHFPWV